MWPKNWPKNRKNRSDYRLDVDRHPYNFVQLAPETMHRLGHPCDQAF